MWGPGAQRRTQLEARMLVPEGTYRLLSEICEMASSRSFDLPGKAEMAVSTRDPRKWKGCRQLHFADRSGVSSHSGARAKQATPRVATFHRMGKAYQEPSPRTRVRRNQPRRPLAIAAHGETLWTTTIAIGTAQSGEVTGSQPPEAPDTATANPPASAAIPAPTQRSDTDSAAPWSPCIRWTRTEPGWSGSARPTR